MRLATCKYNNQDHLAVEQDNALLIPSICADWPGELNSMLQLIDSGEQSLQKLKEIVQQASTKDWIPLSEVELLSPIPRPRQNIMCLGWNYTEHVEENNGVFGQFWCF